MNLSNTATERAFLGCVLFDNSILDDFKASARLFSDALNREVWSEIEKAISRGNRADLVELRLRMPDKAAFIAGLTDCGTFVNVGLYHNELLELAAKRAFFDMAKGIGARLNDGEPVEKIADYCETAMGAIADNAEDGYRHVSAIIPGILQEVEKAIELKGALSGIPTGIEKLDGMTNGWQPEYWIIGARPSTGKSALMLHFAYQAITSTPPGIGLKRKAGIFSAEMSDTSLIKRIVSDRSSVDHHRIRSGFFASGDMDRIGYAMAELSELGLYVNDTPNISKNALISEARKMRRKEKVDIIFVDYIGLVQNENRDLPRHEQIAEISRSMKGLSRELGIPIIALSQLTRDSEGKRPTMANIRESGALEQDSDGIILLWDNGPVDLESEKITLIVAKQRNGPIGDVPLLFNRPKMRFRQAETERWD